MYILWGCYVQGVSHLFWLALVCGVPGLVIAITRPEFLEMVLYTYCIQVADKFSVGTMVTCAKRCGERSSWALVTMLIAGVLFMVIAIVLAVFRILKWPFGTAGCLAACLLVNMGLVFFSCMLFWAIPARVILSRMEDGAVWYLQSPLEFSLGGKAYLLTVSICLAQFAVMFVATLIPARHALAAKISLFVFGAAAAFAITVAIAGNWYISADLSGHSIQTGFDAATYILGAWAAVAFALMYWHCYYDLELNDSLGYSCDGCCNKSPPPSPARPSSPKLLYFEGVYDPESGELAPVRSYA